MKDQKQWLDHEGKQRNKKGVTCLCLNVVQQKIGKGSDGARYRNAHMSDGRQGGKENERGE